MTKVVRQKKTTNVDERILASAIELFATKGYAEITIQDIAKHAATSTSQICYYFEGKESLYVACIESSAKLGLKTINFTLTPVKTIDEFKIRISIFIDDYFVFHIDHKFQSLLIRKEFSNPSKLTNKIIEKTLPFTIAKTISFFKCAQNNKVFKPDVNISQIALIFLSSLITLVGEPELLKLASQNEISDSNFRNSIRENLILIFQPFFMTTQQSNNNTFKPFLNKSLLETEQK